MIYAIFYQIVLILVSLSILGFGINGVVKAKSRNKKLIFSYSIMSSLMMLVYAIDPLVQWKILSVNELLLLKFLGLFLGILPFEQVSISLVKMGATMMNTPVPKEYQILIYVLTFIRGFATVINYTTMVVLRTYIPMVMLVWVYLTSALIIIISMMLEVRKIRNFLEGHRSKIKRGSSRFHSSSSISPMTAVNSIKITIINPYQESFDIMGKTISKLSLLAMFLGFLIISGTIYFACEIASVIEKLPHTQVGSFTDTSYQAPYYYMVGMVVITVLNAIPLSYNYPVQ